MHIFQESDPVPNRLLMSSTIVVLKKENPQKMFTKVSLSPKTGPLSQ